MQTISTEQLQQMKQSGEEFALLNVLPQGLFEQAHIPGVRKRACRPGRIH
jgi:hypothetical protein